MYLVVYAPNGIDSYTVPDETHCEERLSDALDKARRLVEEYGSNFVKVFREVPVAISISVEALF